MESYRNRDTNVEVEISKYLDEKFYPSINAKINRFKNKEDQLLGKDILFTYLDLTDAIVDEKAKTHYINKGIPTFAFELSFIHDGKVIPGWLIDSKFTF